MSDMGKGSQYAFDQTTIQNLRKALAVKTANYNKLIERLNPSIDYVEGMPVKYGEDEIDRLNAENAQLKRFGAEMAKTLRRLEARFKEEGTHTEQFCFSAERNFSEAYPETKP